MQPTAEELIKEIAQLEMEVVHLENYLLSLYRAAFSHHQGTSPSALMEHGSQSLLHDAKLQTTDQENSTVHSTKQCVNNDTCALVTNQSSLEDFEKQRDCEIQLACSDHCSADADHCIYPPRENCRRVCNQSLGDYLFIYTNFFFFPFISSWGKLDVFLSAIKLETKHLVVMLKKSCECKNSNLLKINL